MDKSVTLLKKYIDFSKKSKKCTNLGFYVGSIVGRIIIGSFVITCIMARIPLSDILDEINIGSYTYNSQNIYQEEVYKYFTDEYLAYSCNWLAILLSIFFLFIYTKLFMGIISCTITGAYSRLNIKKEYTENDDINQQESQSEESLINYYFNKSYKVCIGSIFAHAICYPFVILTSFFKLFVKVLFGLPIYGIIIAIMFYPVVIVAMFLIKRFSEYITN
eukprot:jgi/Orpsp1_1/1179737/evm.model.c7180000070593.1